MPQSNKPKNTGRTPGRGARKPASLESLDRAPRQERDAQATANLVALRAPAEEKDSGRKASKRKSAAPPEAGRPGEDDAIDTAIPRIVAPVRQKDGRVEFEKLVPLDMAAGYLEEILTGLTKGNVRFEKGAESLAVRPAGLCALKIEAERKGKKERIKVDVSWRIGR